MTIAEQQLAKIGFGQDRGGPPVWSAVRLDPPMFTERDPYDDPEPARSEALACWRKVLARGQRSSPYRISRIAG